MSTIIHHFLYLKTKTKNTRLYGIAIQCIKI